MKKILIMISFVTFTAIAGERVDNSAFNFIKCTDDNDDYPKSIWIMDRDGKKMKLAYEDGSSSKYKNVVIKSFLDSTGTN